MAEADSSNGKAAPSTEDVKRKFKEALERKNQHHAKSNDHLDGRSKATSPTGTPAISGSSAARADKKNPHHSKGLPAEPLRAFCISRSSPQPDNSGHMRASTTVLTPAPPTAP